MRAPSCAKRTAIPRPIPLLPPVTNATRFTSGIRLLVCLYGKLVSIAHSQKPHYRSYFARFLPHHLGITSNEAAPQPPSYRPPAPACPPTPPPPSSAIARRRPGL